MRKVQSFEYYVGDKKFQEDLKELLGFFCHGIFLLSELKGSKSDSPVVFYYIGNLRPKPEKKLSFIPLVVGKLIREKVRRWIEWA